MSGKDVGSKDHLQLLDTDSQYAGRSSSPIYRNTEEPKVAIEQDRGLTVLRHMIHIAPTLITAAVLALSFKSVYFVDLGFYQINTILKAFQFAAKFHEILLATSLSAIVLHRIRYELCVARGVPFGFVASGYQLSAVGFLFTTEFWASMLSRRDVRDNLLLPLRFLIPGAILLTAVAGPSSAIAMIPELEWWHYDDPFNKTGASVFINTTYSYSDLWPKTVTAANVQSCSAGIAEAGTCPNSSYADIVNWGHVFYNQKGGPNITLLNNGQVSRYLSATDNDMGGNWSAASTVTERMARTLGELYQYAVQEDLKVSSLARPLLIPSIPDKKIYKPLVQVQCGQIYDANTTTSISYPHDQLAGFNDTSEPWQLEPSFTSFYEGHMLFDWVDLSEQAGTSNVIGALFGFSTGQWRQTLMPCTVAADWVPVKPWLDPKIDSTVLQDSPDPFNVLRDPSFNQTRQPITIGLDWANILNSNPSGRVLPNYGGEGYTNLSVFEAEAVSFGYQDGSGYFKVMPPSDVSYQWCMATILSLQVADGLARIGSDSRAYVWHRNTTNSTGSFVKELDNLALLNNVSWYPRDLDFDVAARNNGSQYVAIEWDVLRFGYGWGFRGATFYFAATVLILHALLAIAHVFAALARQWTTSSWGTMAEMLALAINSRPTERLRNTSAGVDKRATWKEIVRIRDVDGARLSLVFDDTGVGEKPALGRRYH